MKEAAIFPGQGSQIPGMGKELMEQFPDLAPGMFARANEILDFEISKIMFGGTEEELKQTSVTQPAIYIHSVILATALGLKPGMVAGHSLGEFSALAAAGAITFEDGLKLVAIRAKAMQRACDANPSAMAALVGMENAAVEALCADISSKGPDYLVVPANYNSPGQIVVSGTVGGVDLAILEAKSLGAKMAVRLPVNGAFHSPLMASAGEELEKGIATTIFKTPVCPIYQNVSATAVTNPDTIRANLIAQLTAPVRWTQTIQQMIADSGGPTAVTFTEYGPGKVLAGLVKRIDKNAIVSSRSF
jgi:[acyl-carrier-protein] S-malonyltransferase